MSWGEGSMNWAELRDLVEALPQDSATKAALAGDVDGRRWRDGDFSTAAVYNALLTIIRILWTAHLQGQPPDMTTISPPRTQEDLEAEEAAANRAEFEKAALERLAPPKAPPDKGAEIDEWRQKVAALQAARQQQPQQ